MTDEIFREGGPMGTKGIGPNKYEMRIEIPVDSEGLISRECLDEECSPGYFKVKPGTGIIENHILAFCPYCRTSAEPDEFLTKAHKEYALALLENEAVIGIEGLIEQSLNLGPTGRKKFGSDMFSVEMSYKPSRRKHIRRPAEDELRRDILCQHCSLKHAVFGLATWCPDCGEDIFLNHVEKELQVIEKTLSAVDTRRADLGARVAARDIENALEDVVTIFEVVLKVVTRRHLMQTGLGEKEVAKVFNKKVRNRYQNVATASDTFKECVGYDLYGSATDEELAFLRLTFEKRHPITHNLGIVDRKYLERALTAELVGREVLVTKNEVQKAKEIALNVLTFAYQITFGDSDKPVP